MNLLALLTFIVVEVIFIAFIVLIARSGLKDSTDRAFLSFLIAFALWGGANFGSNLTFLNLDLLLWLNRLLFVVSIVGLLALLVFILRMTNQKPGKVGWTSMWAITGVGALVSVLPVTVEAVYIERTFVVGIDFGMLALVYFLAVVSVSGMILRGLIKGVRQRSAVERSRARVLFVSIGIAITVILVSNVLVPIAFNNFGLTMVGLFAGMFIIAGVSYGIVRHGMFDIRQAAVRSVTYSLVLTTLAACYFVMAFLISTFFGNVFMNIGQAVSGVVISLTLALLFQPLRKFFDHITRRVFYRNEYNTDEFYAALNRTVVSTTDLRSLLQRISEQIQRALKSEQVFFVLETTDGHHVVAGAAGHAKMPIADARDVRDFLAEKGPIAQTSLLKAQPHIRRILESHRVEVAMTLSQGKMGMGLLFLGERLASSYTQRHMKLLQTISDELVIAIQNALSVQEVRDINASLEQRINNATKELRRSNAQLQRLDEAKDEFISMASHQLRTPLTSIKGYISMLAEGDAGKVTKEQKHLLDEAFMSSERMVRLIGDFLNVSRLQTGKFLVEKAPADLSQIVEEEISSLHPNAAARDLKFTYKRPKNIPRLNLDDSKIRQVIMNFADNAMYYSKDKSTIKIELKLVGDWVEFTVKDKGIGVPESEKSRLFTKFFRAANARKQRPDGTGVGLFLAKKVVDAHSGQIIFESQEGKGSTFGFRLPIAKLRVTSDTK